ncbi:MAG: hypothetical protein WA003_15810 [Desulfuromonadaceae bacterium]
MARDYGLITALLGVAIIAMSVVTTHAHAEVYTLSNATDWPMLMQMISMLRWMVGGLMALVLGLGVAAWGDLRSGLNAKCKTCNEGIMREHDALWDAVETCCPREAANARDRKLRAAYRGTR